MSKSGSRRRLLTTSALLGALTLGLAVAGGAQAQTRSYNIPAEPLSQALRDYGRASGRQIIFTEDLVRGRSAPAVKGEFSADAALARLLGGAGLSSETTPSGAVMIVREAASPQRDRAQAAPDQPTALDEVVVTANKREQSARDVAGTVTAVGSAQLEHLNAFKIADYAAFAPGLQVQPSSSNGFQTIVLRGIAPQFQSATTATYVDEVPVGSVSNVASGAFVAVDIDPSDLQRVEVLNGPQGTLYGASSLGGVVKYVTRLPSLGEVEGHVSADGFAIAHGGQGAELRGGISAPVVRDQLAIGISAHYRTDPGYVDDIGIGGKDSNSGGSEGVHLTAYYAPNDAWSVKLGAMFDKTWSDGTNAVHVDPTTRAPTYGKLTVRHLVPTDYEQPLNLYSLTVEHTFPGGVTMTSATGYSTLNSFWNSDATYGFLSPILGLGPDEGLLANVTNDVDKTTQELRFASAKGQRLEWLAGGFFQHEHGMAHLLYSAQEANGTPIDFGAPIIETTKTNSLTEYAGFGNLTYHLTPTFEVTGGYRFSLVSQDDVSGRRGLFGNPADPTTFRMSTFHASEQVSTWLASARWEVQPNVVLYARAASGYRPGGSRSAPAGAPPDFDTTYHSDSLWSYEAGLKGSWFDNRLSADLAAFWIDWSDIQEGVVVNTFFVVGNGGKARSRGFEAAVRALPIDGLTLNGTLTYTDAVFLEDNPGAGTFAGQPIPRVAKWTGGLAAEYSFPVSGTWNGFFGGDLQAASSSMTIEGFKQDGYSLIGLHAGVADDKTRVSLYVRNLADQYRYIGTVDTVFDNPFEAVITQPRTIGLSVSRRF